MCKVAKATERVNSEGQKEDAFVLKGLEVDVGNCFAFGS